MPLPCPPHIDFEKTPQLEVAEGHRRERSVEGYKARTSYKLTNQRQGGKSPIWNSGGRAAQRIAQVTTVGGGGGISAGRAHYNQKSSVSHLFGPLLLPGYRVPSTLLRPPSFLG